MCDGRRRGGLACTASPVFMIGASELETQDYRVACDTHLGKVIRWQIARLAITDEVVTVAVIRRSAPPT